MDYPGLILAETPWWAFVILALLIFLGVRRLRSRVRSPGVALIAPAAFLIWSLFNVVAYHQAHSALVAWSTLIGLSAAGWASGRLYSSETVERTDDGRFLFHGTPEPLITYIAIFIIRFGLEVWQGFQPAAASVAGGVAIGVSAFAAGRTAQRALRLFPARRTSTETA